MSINITQSKVNKNIDWENSENINIENFSLSIDGKKLYDNTDLIINKKKIWFFR